MNKKFYDTYLSEAFLNVATIPVISSLYVVLKRH
jgi:hypothetical protein